jgi:hypothetical protein
MLSFGAQCANERHREEFRISWWKKTLSWLELKKWNIDDD